MAKYELTGTIKLIGEVQSFASGFTKRQFVVTTADDKYPQDIALEFVKDHCVKLDSFRVGDGCNVTFDIRGNEYNSKYYVQLSAFKIERTSDGLGVTSPEYGQREAPRNSGPGMPPAPKPDPYAGYEDDTEDTIPF